MCILHRWYLQTTWFYIFYLCELTIKRQTRNTSVIRKRPPSFQSGRKRDSTLAPLIGSRSQFLSDVKLKTTACLAASNKNNPSTTLLTPQPSRRGKLTSVLHFEHTNSQLPHTYSFSSERRRALGLVILIASCLARSTMVFRFFDETA